MSWAAAVEHLTMLCTCARGSNVFFSSAEDFGTVPLD